MVVSAASEKGAKKKTKKKVASKLAKRIVVENGGAKKVAIKKTKTKKRVNLPNSRAAKKSTMKATTSRRTSPLLRSALEVLEHGLWHFFRSDTPTDLKFAIMHVDQAVELLLKEKVRESGNSIYKNPKETISIWAAHEKLDELGCRIPEKPNLELLHEERNNIQHKYSNPSPDDAAFHVTNGAEFAKRFLEEELAVDIYDHVPSDFLDELFNDDLE